jgi:hypothetical protein
MDVGWIIEARIAGMNGTGVSKQRYVVYISKRRKAREAVRMAIYNRTKGPRVKVLARLSADRLAAWNLALQTPISPEEARYIP